MGIEITERSDRTWLSYLSSRLVRYLGPEMVVAAPKWGIGWKDVEGSPKLTVTPFGMQGTTVVPRIVEKFNIYDILPGPDAKKDASAPKKRIIAFAGGAFMAPAGPFHWTSYASFVNKTPNSIVSLVSYPLTPFNTAPKVYQDILKVLQTLSAEAQAAGEKIILVGDSAGGNLVLGLPLAALAENPKAILPSAIIAVSPAVDFNHANPKSEEIGPLDCILTNKFCKDCCKLWAGGWSYDDPRISPIKADVSLYKKHGVKVHGVIGKHDVLAPDAEEYVKKLQAAGVDGKWLIWDNQGHDFALAAVFGLLEAKAGLHFLATLLREA